MARLLHIIERQSDGGACRAMRAMARCSTGEGAHQHDFLSLLPADSNQPALSQGAVRDAIEHADIVVIHFWNTPELYTLLRADLPPARLLLVAHIGGLHAPQVITPDLAHLADLVLAVSPFTSRLPALQALPADRTAMVFPPADFGRLVGLESRPHGTFNVGYIGTLSPVKIHPNFVPMSAQIDVPNPRFIVCGSKASARRLLRQVTQLGLENRFDFRGYIEQIGPVLAELDVFGYPLCEDNYSTSDLSVQEAMFAGVSPVVFPYGGVPELVQHNRTGLIVKTEAEYIDAIQRLYRQPEERQRLGNAAREYAQRHFGFENARWQLLQMYERLLAWPKRARRLADAPPDASGAELFAASLGESAPQFRASLESSDAQELLAAERRIARSSPVLQNEQGGGVFHYRNAYPKDGMLRLWSGLILMELGQNVRALSEFQAALSLGCRHWRTSWYLAQTAARLQVSELVLSSLRQVIQTAPEFADAQGMLRRWEQGVASE